jgi:hypothetical protein
MGLSRVKSLIGLKGKALGKKKKWVVYLKNL